MSWHGIKRLGENDVSVYDMSPIEVVRSEVGITFNNRIWLASESRSRPGERVRVYVPMGALSGLNKHAVVQLQDGTVEAWPRKDA